MFKRGVLSGPNGTCIYIYHEYSTTSSIHINHLLLLRSSTLYVLIFIPFIPYKMCN